MQFNDNLPIYLQIVNQIKKEIATEKLMAGEKLDSVRDLAKKLKVNPNTIARVYSEMEQESLVYTERGMGTFLTKDKDILKKLKNEMAKNIVDTYILQMSDLGFSQKETLEILSKKLKGDYNE
ncbi:MAG TPA: GntR family transcriptional regulator [Erysipelotrichaceae bacterium]|nr:GntR family transcriptional regulator [Erysipelotrichaceae bacterium]